MIDLSNFVENLSALMAEQHLNAPALAKAIATDRSNITRYLKGERLPKFQIFIALLEYFNVSADVLLGLKEYVNETHFLPLPPFGERLREVMKETKTTQYKIELDEKISGNSMYQWLNGESLPTVYNLVKLAKYMDISVDYLLGRVR